MITDSRDIIVIIAIVVVAVLLYIVWLDMRE